MLEPDDWQKIDVTYSMSIITREISKYDNSFVKYWISAYIPDGTIVSDKKSNMAYRLLTLITKIVNNGME
jgi:hypothetical protein